MSVFGAWTLTNFGNNITAQAWANGGTIQVTSVVGGSGFPAVNDNPQTYTTLKTAVLNATITGQNNLIPNYLTVRALFSSASPAGWIGTPATFNLNEIGLFGHLGAGATQLIAYTTVGGNTGDTITPTGGGVAVTKDFALQVRFTQAASSSGTIQLVQVVGTHANSHTMPTGTDPLPAAGSTVAGQVSTGGVPIPDGTGNQVLVSTRPVSWTSGIVPIGTLIDYAGVAAPTGWLLADGSSQLRATYPALFTAIGTTWGAVDGTHFTLPNTLGRVCVGYGAQGIGSTTYGGESTVTLTANQMPNHVHTVFTADHIHSASGHAIDHSHSATGASVDHVHTVPASFHSHYVPVTVQIGGASIVGEYIGPPGHWVRQVNPGAPVDNVSVLNASTSTYGTAIPAINTSGSNYGGGYSLPCSISVGGSNYGGGYSIPLSLAVGGSNYGGGYSIPTSVTASGGGAAHDNMPPYLVVYKLIRAF